MKKKTAIVFGATGLTGRHLVEKLIHDETYTGIKIFTRSDPGIRDGKTEVFLAGMDNIDDYENEISGDVLFCCLGTTMKKAGSRENFRKIDFEYPLKIANIAVRNKVNSFIVISSIGAGPQSSSFYLRTKGEMEKALQRLDFKKLIILRPSLLLGKRDDFRFGEKFASLVMRLAGIGLRGKLRKYRAIKAEIVASAMVKAAKKAEIRMILESDEIESVGSTA
jgi:uncharacterized protein YbjT (DUF2867 family)